MRTKQKIVHRRGPSNLNLGIFVYTPLMFAGLHNHPPLWTMVKRYKQSLRGSSSRYLYFKCSCLVWSNNEMSFQIIQLLHTSQHQISCYHLTYFLGLLTYLKNCYCWFALCLHKPIWGRIVTWQCFGNMSSLRCRLGTSIPRDCFRIKAAIATLVVHSRS